MQGIIVPLAVPGRRLRTSERTGAPNGSSGFVQPLRCLVPTNWEVSSGRSCRSLSLRIAQSSKRVGDARCFQSAPFLRPLFSMFLSGLLPLSSLTRPPFPFHV